MKFDYKDDGKTHINIYSKGLTELGRFLSNFAYAPITLPEGVFASIEGYWYYLGLGDDVPERKALMSLYGVQAKLRGRELGSLDWPVEVPNFKAKILDAIRIKLQTYPSMLKALKENNLPLTHYYVYGNKLVKVPAADWIVEAIEKMKVEL